MSARIKQKIIAKIPSKSLPLPIKLVTICIAPFIQKETKSKKISKFIYVMD